MVSLAISAIGVVVLFVAVDGGHNRHAAPEHVESGIWNPTKENPPVDCKKQKADVGEAKDGEDCGPASVSPFMKKANLAHKAIKLCCEEHLVCTKGEKKGKYFEYKCKKSGVPPHHA